MQSEMSILPDLLKFITHNPTPSYYSERGEEERRKRKRGERDGKGEREWREERLREKTPSANLSNLNSLRVLPAINIFSSGCSAYKI